MSFGQWSRALPVLKINPKDVGYLREGFEMEGVMVISRCSKAAGKKALREKVFSMDSQDTKIVKYAMKNNIRMYFPEYCPFGEFEKNWQESLQWLQQAEKASLSIFSL